MPVEPLTNRIQSSSTAPRVNAGYLRPGRLRFLDQLQLGHGTFRRLGCGHCRRLQIPSDHRRFPAARPSIPTTPLTANSWRSKLVHRSHISWSDDGISASLFMDYSSHISSTNPVPPGFTNAQLQTLYPGCDPTATNFLVCANRLPEQYLFDVSLGYNTMVTNRRTPYLHPEFESPTGRQQCLRDRSPPFSL